MNIITRIAQDICLAVKHLQEEGRWPTEFVFSEPIIQASADTGGDFFSSCALEYAIVLGRNPLIVAEELKKALREPYAQIQIAHPGILNMVLSDMQWNQVVEDIVSDGVSYATTTLPKKKKSVVEVCGIEPAAPLSVQKMRSMYFADAMARVLSKSGHSVVRECVVYDRGRSVDVLAESVMRTYFRQHGMNVPYANDLYRGEYIDILARTIDMTEVVKLPLNKMEEGKALVKKQSIALMRTMIESCMRDKMNILVDTMVAESDLYEQGLHALAIKKIRTQDGLYEESGKSFVRTSRYGEDKDRPLTQPLSDAATIESAAMVCYERAVKRRFPRVIMVLAPDEHSYEKRWRILPEILGVKIVYDVMRVGQSVFRSAQQATATDVYMDVARLCDRIDATHLRFAFLRIPHTVDMIIDIDRMIREGGDREYMQIHTIARKMREVIDAQSEHYDDVPPETHLQPETQRVLWLCATVPIRIREVAENMRVDTLLTYAYELAKEYEAWTIQSVDASIPSVFNRVTRCANTALAVSCDSVGVVV